MSNLLDSARILSRLGVLGAASATAGVADANKLVITDVNGIIDPSFVDLSGIEGDLAAHAASEVLHLTGAQNTWLDSITATATELNFSVGLNDPIQGQFDDVTFNLATHMADEGVHLTIAQNDWLDLITASAVELNYSVGVTSGIQAQFTSVTGDLSTHIADAAKHLTTTQNGWLDTLESANTAPAWDGAALVNLTATNIATGTLDGARLPDPLPAISGANLTSIPIENLVYSDTAADVLCGDGQFRRSQIGNLVEITGDRDLLITDREAVLWSQSASTVTITVPPSTEVDFDDLAQITFIQDSTGVITLAPGAGVVLNSFGASLTTGGQYAVMTLLNRGGNTWTVFGQLA